MSAPEAPAYLSPPTRRSEGWLWIVPKCPYCTREHVHGAGIDGTVDGHRVSHCASGESNAGYFLAEIEPP